MAKAIKSFIYINTVYMFYNITYILYIHKENLWTLSFLLCSICLGFPALDPDVERLVGMSLPMKGGGKGPFDAQVARERIAILTSHNLFTLCFRTSFTRMTEKRSSSSVMFQLLRLVYASGHFIFSFLSRKGPKFCEAQLSPFGGGVRLPSHHVLKKNKKNRNC